MKYSPCTSLSPSTLVQSINITLFSQATERFFNTFEALAAATRAEGEEAAAHALREAAEDDEDDDEDVDGDDDSAVYDSDDSRAGRGQGQGRGRGRGRDRGAVVAAAAERARSAAELAVLMRRAPHYMHIRSLMGLMSRCVTAVRCVTLAQVRTLRDQCVTSA